MQMTTPIKLRKKAPFTCRYVDPRTGKLTHPDHPLAETDGDMCPDHAKATKDAYDKFWKTPVKPVKADDDYLSDVKPRRVWPD